MGLNDFKDEKGLTDIKKALHHLQSRREGLKAQGGNSTALNNEIQYRPLRPSEIFLSKTGNIFPIAELKHRLDVLQSDNHSMLMEKKVSLYFDNTQRYNVNYKIDIENKTTAINRFP